MNVAGFPPGKRLLAGLLMPLVMAGCATVSEPPAPPGTDTLAGCRALFAEVDAAVEQAHVRDHGPSPVRGFPYLRTNRLLASFNGELGEDKRRWATWAGHMAQLDGQARAFELRNLATSVGGRDDDALLGALDGCRQRLLAGDLAQPERRAALREAARVADDYVTWWRVAGLYPLTAPVVSANIAAWQTKARETFDTPLRALPVEGRLERWALPAAPPTPDAAGVRDILRRSRDALGIPQPSPPDLERLFAAFAPIWEVDVVADADRIGLPRWENGPVVDVSRPTLFRKVSHTRFGGQVLLQLNYIVWFPARAGSDIYAGRLDGIDWRVTLGPDGAPWLYDTIHNCGCYHTFFPTRHLQRRDPSASATTEPAFMPQPAPAQPVVLRIAPRTHLLQQIYTGDAPPTAHSLTMDDYDGLRALPVDGGYRSLFGRYGLVAGTQRAERFLLWPMGVRSPGAMRQWGHHATAFVGRRHFDDPFLVESLFESTDQDGGNNGAAIYPNRSSSGFLPPAGLAETRLGVNSSSMLSR